MTAKVVQEGHKSRPDPGVVQVRRIALGQAARFPGLTAAAVSLLLIHPKRRGSN